MAPITGKPVKPGRVAEHPISGIRSLLGAFPACSLMALATSGAHAQYTGGSSDGHTLVTMITVECVPYAISPFAGGPSDGHSNVALITVSCAPRDISPFSGGISDGISDAALITVSCAPRDISPFSGGISDGHSDVALITVNCAPRDISPFSGGIADGHSDVAVINVNCTPRDISPFSGGISDGHANVAVINVNCTPRDISPFSGGISDGHANVAVINVNCAPRDISPFSGGISDGHANVAVINVNCTPRDISPFSGGISDGHANVAVINVNCAPRDISPFSGGVSDGFSHVTIVNLSCSPIAINPFSGGLADGYSSISRLVLDPLNCSILLPVELVSFRAACDAGQARITWSTATESNNDHFTIGRSADGLVFEDIGVIDGAGNSTATVDYAFTDTDPFSDITYYRLKQTDFDGTSALSDVIAIHCMGNADAELSVYPNPTTDLLHIRISDDGSPWELYILNAQGALVHTGSLSGSTTFRADALPPGMYVVKVKQPGATDQDHYLARRFIKN